MSRDLELGAVPAVSPSTKVFPILITFGMYTVSQKTRHCNMVHNFAKC